MSVFTKKVPFLTFSISFLHLSQHDMGWDCICCEDIGAFLLLALFIANINHRSLVFIKLSKIDLVSSKYQDKHVEHIALNWPALFVLSIKFKSSTIQYLNI